jgi:hypothetical protein
MMLRPSAWGALLGALVAFVVLAVAAYALVTADGSNYKALAAVWLWLLPALGLFAGSGYAIGKAAEALDRAEEDRDA